MVAKHWSIESHDLPNFSALALVWDTTYNEDILYLGMNYGFITSEIMKQLGPLIIRDCQMLKFNELEINTADNKLYVATYGRGLWRVNLFDPDSFRSGRFTNIRFDRVTKSNHGNF